MRARPAVQKGVRYILEKFGADGGRELPPIRAMARESGISYRSMWAAVKFLSDREIAEVRHGRSARLRNPSPDQKLSEVIGTTEPVIDRIARHVLEDIRRGHFRKDVRLPSYKSLGARYGGHYLTTRAALNLLERKGFLRAYGNSFVVNTIAPGPAGLVLFTILPRRRTDEILWLDFGMTIDILRGCEAAGPEHGISVRLLVYDPDDGRLHDPILPGRPPVRADPATALGCIFVNDNLDCNAASAVRFLLASGYATSVIDCMGQERQTLPERTRQRVLTYCRIVDSRPGMDCGRYLWELGHRKIAFLSINESLSWSRQRLAGLSDVYTTAGFPDTVHEFCCDTTRTDFVTQVLRALGDHRTYLPPRYHADADIELPDACARIGDAALNRQTIAPLFLRALEQKGCSAWVLANDYLARFAMEFLRARGIAVPGQVSVMGFDDSFEAVRNNISSYNHGIGTVVSTIVNLLLDQRTPFKVKQNALDRLSGRVVARATTARVRERTQGRAPGR